MTGPFSSIRIPCMGDCRLAGMPRRMTVDLGPVLVWSATYDNTGAKVGALSDECTIGMTNLVGSLGPVHSLYAASWTAIGGTDTSNHRRIFPELPIGLVLSAREYPEASSSGNGKPPARRPLSVSTEHSEA